MKRKIKDVKPIKQETIKYINEDTDQIKKFILILVGVSLIAGLLYFMTAKYLVKDNFQKETEKPIEENIIYDVIRGGNVFNRPYDEYYVFAYDSTKPEASYYAALISNFDIKESKIYFLDLSFDVNKKYIGDIGNQKATKPSELSLKNSTLMVIKNGKISKYYENLEDIEKIIG